MIEMTPREAVELGAVDSLFYSQWFFPKAARQDSPEMHKDIWNALESTDRFVGVEVFRGGAKTTLTRLYTSKRIAYGVSRTILFVSDTKGHAIRSIHWLMQAVEGNRKWAETFKLTSGRPWTGEEIEIKHGLMGFSIRVIAVGMEGQIRGINVDDFRPDLIVVDDPNDEENTGTPEQRKKTAELFFGALTKSLAPASEAPEAKVVLLQTSLNEGDLINMAHRDSQWRTLRFSCFDESGQSRWETRFPTKELMADKQSHVERNQLSLWMREMECTLVSDEMAYFREEWLKYWEVLPERMRTYIIIDPTPPLSDKAAAKNLDTDQQAVTVVGFAGGNLYLCEYFLTRDEDDDELAAKLFGLIRRWRPLAIGIETFAYQRRLERFLSKEMQKRRVFVTIKPLEDRRNKRVKIRQGISGRAVHGRLWVNKRHTEFLDQYIPYPQVKHDDLLETVALAEHMENDADGTLYEGEFSEIEDEIPLLDDWRLLA